jgi:hypothetical protein
MDRPCRSEATRPTPSGGAVGEFHLWATGFRSDPEVGLGMALSLEGSEAPGTNRIDRYSPEFRGEGEVWPGP